jgi:hypothetical protein
LLAHGQWFSLGTLASSTNKTGRHDIAEILLKVALKHQKSKQTKNQKLVPRKFSLDRFHCTNKFIIIPFITTLVNIYYI